MGWGKYRAGYVAAALLSTITPGAGSVTIRVGVVSIPNSEYMAEARNLRDGKGRRQLPLGR